MMPEYLAFIVLAADLTVPAPRVFAEIRSETGERRDHSKLLFLTG